MNRFVLSAFSALAALCLATGCRSAHPGGQSSGASNSAGSWHSVVMTPRADLPRIRRIDKANPAWWLQNLDDPEPPDWYIPKGKLRKVRWYTRNSFHNFDFYVIGVADQRFVRSGKYPEHVGNPNGGWNYAVTKYKWVRLPFISFQGKKVEWYVGWRNGGNFGIALRHSHQQQPLRARTVGDL